MEPTEEEPDRLLTVAQVAELTKCPSSTIYNWMRWGTKAAGKLPHERMGGTILVSEHELCVWLLACRDKGPQNYDADEIREQSRKLHG